MTEATKTGVAEGSLGREISEVWRVWPDKPLFFAVLAAWLALFHFLGNSTFGYVDTGSLFLWLDTAYNAKGSDDGHGNLIPFVVLVLFWLKREELLAVGKRIWWPALGLVGLAVALHFAGYLVQQPRVSVVALILGIYGLMGLVWGRELMRVSFFPFCLLIFCVPVGSLGEALTFPLRILVTKLTVWVSHDVLALDVVRDGSRIFDSQRKFSYDVAPACSGIRSLVSLLALTTIYGFVTFKTAWRRGVMVAMALPLAVLGNVLRLVIVVLVADVWGQEAGQRVETNLGFLTFAVALGFSLWLGHFLREDKRKAPAEVGA
jgi:exosortase